MGVGGCLGSGAIQNHLVGFQLGTILTDQSHISKVWVIIKLKWEKMFLFSIWFFYLSSTTDWINRLVEARVVPLSVHLACTDRGVVLALINLLFNVSKTKILSAWISSFKSNRNESNLLYFHLCHHFRPLDLLLQPPLNFHSTISFDLSDTWLSPNQGFSFSTTIFSLGSIRSSSFARMSGLLTKEKNKN